MTVLYSSTHSLSWMEFSNAASSAIVIGGTWRIYVDSSYQGTYNTLRPGHYRDLSLGHDRVSSVKLLNL